jgi:SAM-dependent methyltransferase
LGPGCVHPRHKKLVHGLYGILQEAGIVSIRVGDGVAIRTAVPVDPAPSRELQNMLLDSFPLYSAELELLNITGPQLASCLYGRRDPIDLLLNDQRGRDLLSQFYLNGPLCATGSRMLCEFLADILASRKEKVKILEIGAGTGGTSKIVIDQLRRMNNVSFEYCFTDISPTLVAAAKQQFELSDYYPFMSFMVLDIENPPPESSELLGQYDIVISTNCIHATKSLVESTANIRRILRRPGGLLCLVEGTRPLVWCDIVFGLLDGWWAFEDGRTQALTDELVWKESLMKAGYEYVAWSTGESPESDCLRLIVATASGDT